MKLRILIPSTPDREQQALSLVHEIMRQSPMKWATSSPLANVPTAANGIISMENEDVGFIIYTDDKVLSVGEKRDLLYGIAGSHYSWQVDSDDQIAPNAIELILAAIEQNPDCICFKELVDIDGVISHSNFSLDYEDWEGEGGSVFPDGFTYHRTPFFKTPIKTALCQQVGVKHIRYAEDIDFARRIKPLLKTQVYIPEFIYHYIHRSSPFNERYGIND